MSPWQSSAPLSSQQMYLPQNDSREAFDAEDLAASEIPPASPVFDFDDFLIDSSSHQMAESLSSSVNGQRPSQRDNGAANSWASWASATSIFQENVTNAFLSSPSSLSHSASVTIPPATTTLGTQPSSYTQQHPSPFKFQEAAIASPQSVLDSIYAPQLASYIPTQPTSYQPGSATFSDYELAGMGTGMPADIWHTNKLDDQQIQMQYQELGKLSQGGQDYAHQTVHRHHSVYQQPTPPTGREDEQRRPFVNRRDSSVPPYPTDYRRMHSKAAAAAVFATSAPAPSILSNITTISPAGSPRSVRGVSLARSSPSLVPASPKLITPSSPTAQYSASPAQLSASPHQFTSTSPIFTSTSPITFVNQTTQFSTPVLSDELSSAQESSAPDGSHIRKRRRTVSTDVEDDSDDRRDEDIPTKSELRPPKQAPSMWQVYFADWLQEHKSRYPHDKLNVAQAAKEAGQLYKTLSEDAKEDLRRRVQVEKEVRERRLAAWQRTLTPQDIRRENKFRAAQRKAGLSRRANIKDPNAPKKPLSAYFMFLARIRSDPVLVEEVFGGETETTRQSVLAARRWREMSDEEKKPFLTQAEHDKIQYEALRKVYEEQSNAKAGHASRKSMTGTGYIVPQQLTAPRDITASIISARPIPSDTDEFRMVSYDPEATITARKNTSKSAPIPIFTSSAGTVRRRTARKTARTPGNDATSGSSSQDSRAKHGADSGIESSESDDEWVPGKSI